MRDHPTLQNIWRAGEYIGEHRPVARATVQRGNVRLTSTKNYGDFASIIFSTVGDPLPSSTPEHPQSDPTFMPKEIPTLKSVSWNRDADNEIADCTIELWNTREDPVTGEFLRGFYTWNRGDSPFEKVNKRTVTTTPTAASVGNLQSDILNVSSVDQQFVKTEETAKVAKVKLEMPSGTSGQFVVGIKNDPAADRTRLVDVHTTVTLVPGGNLITLPQVLTLTRDKHYHLTITPTPGRTFNAPIARKWLPGGVALPARVSKPSLNILQQHQVHVPFQLFGPPVTTTTTRNDWHGLLVPDNIIRTFEGYGATWDQIPESDPKLMMTGTWLIDEVSFNAAVITIKCRDFARILTEQVFFPPIVPRKSAIPGIQYPIYFDHYNSVPDPDSARYSPVKLTYRTSSNVPYIGHNSIHGHRGPHAFDGNAGSYWLSVGNNVPNSGHSYEYVEASCKPSTIGQIRLRPYGGHMRGYVSLYADGHWITGQMPGYRGGVIPYNPEDPLSAPNGANIPYVSPFNTLGDGFSIKVGFQPVKNVTRIRVTFHNLVRTSVGPYVYRAGVRELAADAQVIPMKKVGNYGDWSDIIKLILAWGGFHWPEQWPFIGLSAGFGIPIWASKPRDPFLGNGRIWGDIESTGTYGIVPIPFTDLDKKPLLDGIRQIKDIVGFWFGVDESGGAIWRHANIWQLGNVLSNGPTGTPVRQRRFIRILDTQVLLDITAKLSGRNWRERVYIADPSGKIAGGARGFSLNPIGLRRVAGWIEGNFGYHPQGSKAAIAFAQRMAQLIAVRQMMSTREDTFVIPGNPCLQIDDQVELVDTNVGEGYVHYCKNISSKLDNQTGEYTYTVTTQWLGTRPGDQWIIDKYGKMHADTEALLDRTDYGRKDGVYNGFPSVVIG